MSDEDRLSPAEARVREVLGELREGEPAAGRDVPGRVTSTLRWQRPLRRALVSFGSTAGAMAGGLRALLGTRRP